jgi:hypothetical protein
MAYKETNRFQRKEALDELTELSQQFGLGY